MAAYSPDAAMPGDSEQPVDQASVDQINSAIDQGHSYADIVAYHAANDMPDPPRPSLDAVMSGNTRDASQWSAPPVDPYKLDTPEQARASINQLAEAGAGIGAVEEVGATVGSTIRSLVQTSAEELTPAMSPLDLAVERGA